MYGYVILRVKGDWESNQIEWVGADGSAWVFTTLTVLDHLGNGRVV